MQKKYDALQKLKPLIGSENFYQKYRQFLADAAKARNLWLQKKLKDLERQHDIHWRGIR